MEKYLNIIKGSLVVSRDALEARAVACCSTLEVATLAVEAPLAERVCLTLHALSVIHPVTVQAVKSTDGTYKLS